MPLPAGSAPAKAPLPITPSVEAWRAMSPEAREKFQLDALDSMEAAAEAMGEGRPHKNIKSRAIDALGLHFRATGRAIYLAEEMTVLYPGAAPFAPDLLAVLDVAQPEEDERMTWVVADEGKGIDLAIEVLHKGDRHKDLVENVERYAALGIYEYFVYDRLKHKLHAYRLPKGATRYQHLVPQQGRYHSDVLDLDLAIFGGTLRFLAGQAELPGSAELIGRLETMMLSVEARLERAEAEAASAKSAVERAEAEAASAKIAVLEGKARGVLAVLRARSVAVSDDDRARITNERDGARLDRWMDRAVAASSIRDVLDD